MKKDKRIETNQNAVCKNCNRKIDAATSMDNFSTPKKGDISVCLYCSTIGEFDNEFNLVPLSEEEINILKSKPIWIELEFAKQIINEYRKTKKP